MSREIPTNRYLLNFGNTSYFVDLEHKLVKGNIVVHEGEDRTVCAVAEMPDRVEVFFA